MGQEQWQKTASRASLATCIMCIGLTAVSFGMIIAGAVNPDAVIGYWGLCLLGVDAAATLSGLVLIKFAECNASRARQRIAAMSRDPL